MPLRQRFETLLLYDPNHSPATANVWIAHPSPSEEQALGKLVVVSSLENTDRINLDIINLIQEELRGGYYRAVDAKPEHAFEQALNQTNRRLHRVITDGVADWVERANILVAAVWRETLVISSVGTIHAFLLRRSLKQGGAVYQMHDLIGSETSAPNPVRLFSHTISGRLQVEDQLLICTSSLLDYFSVEKLRRTLLEGNPSTAVHQWEATLLGVEQRASFAAVVVQALAAESQFVASPSRPVAQATLTQSAPQVSMEHLIAKEQATERLLSPSIWPAFRDLIIQLSQGVSRLVRRLVLRKPPRRIVPTGVARAAWPAAGGAASWSRLTRIIGRGANQLWAVWRALRSRRTSLPAGPPPVTIAPILRRQRRFSLNALVNWFQRLNRPRQWLLAASVILLFILALSMIQKTKPTGTARLTGNVSDNLADHLSKARAALLYGGEAAAQEHLTAAQALADRLPNRRAKDKAARQSTLAAINELVTQLAHRTVLPNPTVVAQLATVTPLNQPQQLYLAGSRLVAIDPDQSIVTAVTLGKNIPAAVIPNALDTGRPTTGTVTGTATLTFATDRRGFVELDVGKETWKPLDSAWPTAGPRVQSLASYQGRLYALDTAASDLVRFSRSVNTLGTGISWLKEKIELGSARALAVDGSLYVLMPNGVVNAFANGRPAVFALNAIDPPLTDATRLWTDVNSKNIYLVDPSRKRIVVFTKTGKLIDQYESAAWEELRDVAVSEKTKTAYVLSGTTISSFPLLH